MAQALAKELSRALRVSLTTEDLIAQILEIFRRLIPLPLQILLERADLAVSGVGGVDDQPSLGGLPIVALNRQIPIPGSQIEQGLHIEVLEMVFDFLQRLWHPRHPAHLLRALQVLLGIEGGIHDHIRHRGTLKLVLNSLTVRAKLFLSELLPLSASIHNGVLDLWAQMSCNTTWLSSGELSFE